MEFTVIKEGLPLLERFINNTGFPIAMLIIIGYFVNKVGVKVYRKLEPIIDSHFELVSELKNTSVEQVGLMDKQNKILVDNFTEQRDILKHIQENQVKFVCKVDPNDIRQNH